MILIYIYSNNHAKSIEIYGGAYLRGCLIVGATNPLPSRFLSTLAAGTMDNSLDMFLFVAKFILASGTSDVISITQYRATQCVALY